jgi:hypothetical protein
VSRPPLRVRLSARRRRVLATGALGCVLAGLVAAPTNGASGATGSPEVATPPAPVAATAGATPGAVAGAADDDAPLEVTLDTMTPSAVPQRGPIVLTGTVTNVSDEEWTGTTVYPFIGETTPMTTAAELRAAVLTEPETVVGGRITEVSDDIEDLAPDETASFQLRVPRSALGVSQPGVYWFGVHALGASDSTGSDTTADGRARTFLPYLPRPRSAVDTAVVVPLRRAIGHTTRGAVAEPSSWNRSMSAGGQLRRALDFGAAADAGKVTWLLDPALPDTVQQLADGNPIRSVGPTALPDDETEGPTSSPGEETEDPEEETADGAVVDSPVAIAARAWMADAEPALQGSDVLELPYGDVDVAAAAEHAPTFYPLARGRGGGVVDQWQLTTAPAVASPSGYLDETGFESIDDDPLVLLTSRMFGEEQFPDGAPGIATVAGRRVAVTSYDVAGGGPGPDPRTGPVALRQRVLSEAAVRVLSDGARAEPLVIVAPRSAPEDAAEFWRGLDRAWVNLTTATDAATPSGPTVAPDRLTYPPRQVRLELDATVFSRAQAIIDDGGTLQNLLTLNDTISARLTDEALTGVGYEQRDSAVESAARLEDTRLWVQRRLEGVRVTAPPGVTLSSDSGAFAVTLRNVLNEPVTVRIVTRSEAGASTEAIDPIEIPAASHTTVTLNVRTASNGVDNLTITLTDSEGEPLGGSATVPVRPGQISTVIWWIIGTGAGLLFLAIAIRLVRRIRGRGPAADADEPGDPAAEPAEPDRPARPDETLQSVSSTDAAGSTGGDHPDPASSDDASTPEPTA